MTIAANAAETDALLFLDSLARVRVSCEQGEGHVSVIELTAPRGSMPPLHVHDEDETFYVLEGGGTFYTGEDVVSLSAGDSLLAPRHVPHTFCAGAEGLRMLVVGGGDFERLVRAVSRPAGNTTIPASTRPWREDTADLVAIAGEHGIDILGPPGMLPTDLA